ncbi:putative U box domain, Zinc finger, RING/FYVE/PHD-type [Helianthus annuus]|nr:putative U box domain, Zinc finger, RING/FYVE/PHD-type [Helianthus annuus]
MASEETTLALSHTNNNRHQTFFQNDPNSTFHHPLAGSSSSNNNNNNNGKATRELTGFIDHQRRYYQQSMYDSGSIRNHGMQNWDGGNARGSDQSDGSDGDDEEDVEGGGGHGSEKDGSVKLDRISAFGSRREVLKVGSLVPPGNDLNDVKPSSSDNRQQELSQYPPNAVTLVDRDGDLYYSQYLHGTEGLASGVKDTVVENGCGFSGRKDVSYAGESGDSLRAILSDPLTGALMDDAMILPCGHSFGSGGMQHVMKIKACHTCSRLVTEDSVAPNLALRSAVLAFRREEESQVHHASKRRRERLDQDRTNYNDSMDARSRGLQFPFSVADRVIIKGNKRTPERFVGCEAVVTTQCLNGWYVVKTLDTAESIKLQYRSLAKVPDNSSSQATSSKMAPNWL